MSAPRPWTVLPHDPVQLLEDNLRAVRGTLPKGHMSRRMSVVRLSDGGLVFHNGVPLQEEEMKALEAWGTPQILLVTNHFHRLDVHAFKVRYPQLRVLCPKASQAAVRTKVHVDGCFEDFPNQPSAELVPLRGSKIGEAALVVRSEGRISLCFSDTVMNIPSMRGLDGLLFRLVGSVGRPKVTPLAKLLGVGNKAQLREHLLELAGLRGLYRLLPTHGEIVEGEAAQTLNDVARAL